MTSEKIDQGDKIEWRDKRGYLHRVDGPAIEYRNGSKEWYYNGYLHRVDGPAVECINGDKEWYQHGKPHRVDGPAIEFSSGKKFWARKGKYFSSKESWFKSLTKKEKIAYLFKMEG